MLRSNGGVFGRNPVFNTVSATGPVTLSNGNIVLSTAGTGISFAATTDASGMTSELLADYEEGTCTPTLTFGGAAVGIAYSNRMGRYTKIGRMVHAFMSVTLSSKGSSTGNVGLIGWPYTNSATNPPLCVGYYANITAVNSIGGYMNGSAASVFISETNDSGTLTALTDADFANDSTLVVAVTYFV